MQKIIFSDIKRTIAEFRADTLTFERQEGSLLISAEGEMLAQDTPALEEIASGNHACFVTVLKGEETVIDGQFNVTFFTLEANTVIVALA